MNINITKIQITILFSIFIVNINPPHFQIHLITVNLFESENKKEIIFSLTNKSTKHCKMSK